MKPSRRHRHAPGTWAALALATSFFGRAARAEVTTARLEYTAPAACGSASEFTARVERRSPRIRLGDATSERSLKVRIEAKGGAFSGVVEITEPDGATRSRRLRATSCEEALEGLALIATVSLDPGALLEAAPEPSPEPPSPAEPPPPSAPAPSEAPRASGRPTRVRFDAGLEALAGSGVAAEPLFGGAAFVDLRLAPDRWPSPSMRLGVSHSQRRGVRAPGGNASFALTLAELDLCPVALGGWLSLRPCASGATGMLVAWGEARLRSVRYSRPFGAAGGAILGRARVSDSFAIVLDFRTMAPLRRDRFAFDGEAFHRVAPVTWWVGAGLGGGFP